MTRKTEKQIDAIVAEVCRLHGLDPALGVKGGQAELANGKVWEAIRNHKDRLIAATNPPATAPAGWGEVGGGGSPAEKAEAVAAA